MRELFFEKFSGFFATSFFEPYVLIEKKILQVALCVGCGKETTKEATSTTEEVNSSEEETGTSEITDDATSESETTTDAPTTTVKQEEATTKQEETTTKKQEVTSTKKQEVTTTKKQETTSTKKQEETTTKKQEETTTQAPVHEETKTWFEQKGYVITSKDEATSEAYRIGALHECTASFISSVDVDEYFSSRGLKCEGIGFTGMTCCYEQDGIWYDYEHESYSIIAFDRYTGIAFEFNGDIGEFEVDGEKITYEVTGGAGRGTRMYEIISPIEYDGLVYLVAKSSNLTYKGNELVAGAKMYTIDEIYDFDAKDVYFLSVDDM